MLMESRLVGYGVVHLGCRVVQLLNHLNRKRPLWSPACRLMDRVVVPPRQLSISIQ